MLKINVCLVAIALATQFAAAQQLTVTVSPNPAPLGAPITVTAQAAVPNLYTPFGCLVGEIRSGSPAGPTVRLYGCTFLGVAIPLYGSATSRTFTWDQLINPGATQAPPGVYWFPISHTPGLFGSPTTTEWFSVTISDPANPNPSLAAVNAPLFGQTFDMSLTAGSAHAGAAYGVALSFTSNVGIPFTGGVASLDPDALFSLSLTQDPVFFANFSGVLDQAGGNLLPIQIHIPALAGVLVVPIHAQAALFTPGGVLLSNGLTIHIH
jgi:hypothetical protein